MDVKKVIGVAFVVVLLLAVAWFFLLSGNGGGDDEKDVSEAFGAYSSAMATGNKNMVAKSISKRFADAGLVYNTAVEEFGIKREGYSTLITNLSLRENTAEISYNRKVIKEGKETQTSVLNEKWMKEQDGKWRLFKLSAKDRVTVARERKKRQEEEERKLEEQLSAGMKADEVEKIKFYTAENKRDPFESLIIVFEEGGVEGQPAAGPIMCDPKRTREFLEGFELFSLKLVGVVFGEMDYALVETPNGNGYTLNKGMYLGRNCGKVVKITGKSVIVTEKYYNPRWGFKPRKMELKLKREES